MANVVEIDVKSNDRTKGFAGIREGLSQALSGLGGIAKAAGADLASSLAGPLVAAAGATATAFASAGAAVGAFGLAAAGQVSSIDAATKAYEKYQAAAPNTKEQDEAFKAYIKTLDGLPPATQEAAGEFITLKDAFKQWSDSLAGDTMPVFTKGLRAARSALPALTPLVKAGAAALSDFMGVVEKDAKSSGFQMFMLRLSTTARRVLPGVLASVRNVAIGFGGILMAFIPFARGMGDGLENLTGKFADFGRNLESNQAFQDWMVDVGDQAPDILDMLGDLVTIILNVGEALAPFTGLTLKVTEALADFVAAIPQDTMDWLAPTIAGIVLGIKAWSVVQGVLNVVLAANPIGLVVLAIAGLALGLYQAYQRSETFRRIVDKAFSVVRDKGKEMWDKIRPGLDRMQELLSEDLPGAAATLAGGLEDLAEKAQSVADKILGINLSLEETPESGGGVIDWFKENWEPVIGTIIAGPLGGAIGAIEDNFGFMNEAFTNGGQWLKDNFRSTWLKLNRTAARGVENLATDVYNGIGDTIEKLLSPWPGAQKRFSKFWSELGSRARSGVTRILSETWRLVRRIAGIRPSWSGLWRGLKSAGHEVVRILNWIWDRARSIGSKITGTVSRLPFMATGGISHAAEGGPRGNLTLVGEQGPEIVRLPQGSQVYPHGQSMGMLGGMGGGGTARLVWAGGPSDEIGAAIWEWLKKNVRLEGGGGDNSVQKALGD